MDWTGFKILNYNGTSFFVYLFLLVLGFSALTGSRPRYAASLSPFRLMQVYEQGSRE
jgi:hypothetical protein